MAQQTDRPAGIGWADVLIGAVLLAGFSIVLAWATRAHPYPTEAGGISLAWWRLPIDAGLSWLRMAVAYAISLVFALVYGYAAAYNPRAQRILIPLLDILQSIPILSFLPVVLLAFIALFPGSQIGVNLAAILLIFTGQVWNMVFAVYQSFTTIPRDLRESAASLGLSPWQRFRTLELPYAMVPLMWNSMMSWAGGWFFLMAAEMFSLGSRQFQLQGLGSYLQTAANRANWGAEAAGLATLVLVIVLMDQLFWRPLLSWANKFKVELIEGSPSRSAILMLLRRSVIVEWAHTALWSPLIEATDRWFRPNQPSIRKDSLIGSLLMLGRTLIVAGIVIALVTAFQNGIRLIAHITWTQFGMVVLATLATLTRVVVALAVSVLWTVPAGVFIGLNRRWSAKLTPLTQVAASVPATALFPGLVALLIHLKGGLNTASILLMVLGTQWYVLFNVIAGAAAIPEDLLEATQMLGLSRRKKWTTLILPAIYPYLITGLITAAGGAWNASIVAEYVSFHHHIYTTFGVGSLIARASQTSQFPLLLVATGTLAATVVSINRLIWRPLYDKARERFSLT